MMTRRLRLLAAALLFGTAATAAPAATLSIVEGKLTGATGVTVGTASYDVKFIEGTCAQVYGTCEASSFDFTDADNDGGSVTLAAQALIDQVFLDTIEGNFRSIPSLTFGCTSTVFCRALIAYRTEGTTLTARSAVVRPDNGGIFLSADYQAVTLDTGQTGTNYAAYMAGQRVFAKFTAVPAAEVPEPTSLAIIAGGLGLIGAARRRRQTRSLT